MDFLRQWTLNIIYVSVLVAFVKALVPENKIRKTVLVAAGIVMLYTISAPVVSLLNKDVKEILKLPDITLKDDSTGKNGNTLESYPDNAFYDSAKVTDIYRQNIEKQIEKTLENESGITGVEAAVTVEDNVKSEEYGFIRTVRILFIIKEQNEKTQNNRIYPTGIGRIVVNTKTAKVVDDECDIKDSKLGRTAVSKVSSLLGISGDIISVSSVYR